LSTKPRINHEIRAPEIRLVDDRGQNLGVMSLEAALRLAHERNLDLVETAPNAKPPVVKLINYGKYRYAEEKALKKQRAKERKDILKTVQISFGAKIHDLEFRAKQAAEFLSEGYRVEIAMRLRGREKAHQDLAYEKMHQFLKIIPLPIKVIQERKSPLGFQILIGKS